LRQFKHNRGGYYACSVDFFTYFIRLDQQGGKKIHPSSTAPLLVSIVVFIVFVGISRGAIRVQPGEIAMGIFLAILMYAAVTAIIYGAAIMWMKKLSSQPKE